MLSIQWVWTNMDIAQHKHKKVRWTLEHQITHFSVWESGGLVISMLQWWHHTVNVLHYINVATFQPCRLSICTDMPHFILNQCPHCDATSRLVASCGLRLVASFDKKKGVPWNSSSPIGDLLAVLPTGRICAHRVKKGISAFRKDSRKSNLNVSDTFSQGGYDVKREREK